VPDVLTVLQSIAGERCSVPHGAPGIFIAELEHQSVNEFDRVVAAIIERQFRPTGRIRRVDTTGRCGSRIRTPPASFTIA
jgi:hypothetical protein